MLEAERIVIVTKEQLFDSLDKLIKENRYPLVSAIPANGRTLYCCCVPPEGHDPEQLLHDYADPESNCYTCTYRNGTCGAIERKGDMFWLTPEEATIFGVE